MAFYCISRNKIILPRITFPPSLTRLVEELVNASVKAGHGTTKTRWFLFIFSGSFHKETFTLSLQTYAENKNENYPEFSSIVKALIFYFPKGKTIYFWGLCASLGILETDQLHETGCERTKPLQTNQSFSIHL